MSLGSGLLAGGGSRRGGSQPGGGRGGVAGGPRHREALPSLGLGRGVLASAVETGDPGPRGGGGGRPGAPQASGWGNQRAALEGAEPLLVLWIRPAPRSERGPLKVQNCRKAVGTRGGRGRSQSWGSRTCPLRLPESPPPRPWGVRLTQTPHWRLDTGLLPPSTVSVFFPKACAGGGRLPGVRRGVSPASAPSGVWGAGSPHVPRA